MQAWHIPHQGAVPKTDGQMARHALKAGTVHCPMGELSGADVAFANHSDFTVAMVAFKLGK